MELADIQSNSFLCKSAPAHLLNIAGFQWQTIFGHKNIPTSWLEVSAPLAEITPQLLAQDGAQGDDALLAALARPDDEVLRFEQEVVEFQLAQFIGPQAGCQESEENQIVAASGARGLPAEVLEERFDLFEAQYFRQQLR